jgi:hypothetical protein
MYSALNLNLCPLAKHITELFSMPRMRYFMKRRIFVAKQCHDLRRKDGVLRGGDIVCFICDHEADLYGADFMTI